MRWYAFTRFPSPHFDQSLETDYPAINEYLQKLDAELVGAKSVRRLTLEEVRDHLLEHTESLIADGKTSAVAASEAILAFGEVSTHSLPQRRERYMLYLRMSVSFGLMFAFLMTLFTVVGTPVNEMDWALLGKQFLFYALFYGLLMSYWFTFGFAQAKPTQSKHEVAQGSGLCVYSGKASKFAAVFLIIVMAFIGVMSLLGVVGIGFMVHNHALVNLLLAAISLQLAFSAPVAFGEYLLTQDSLKIKLPGHQEIIPLAAIQRIETVPKRQRILRVRMGEPHVIHWLHQGESKQTVLLLNGEMHNGDQLLATLRECVERKESA